MHFSASDLNKLKQTNEQWNEPDCCQGSENASLE